MMEIKFGKRRDLPRVEGVNVAKVSVNSTCRKDVFVLTDERIGNIPIFKDNHKNSYIVEKLKAEEEVIIKIAKTKRAKIIFACKYDFFKKLVRNTLDYELDADFLITEGRTILHYAPFGFEPCVLIISAE